MTDLTRSFHAGAKSAIDDLLDFFLKNGGNLDELSDSTFVEPSPAPQQAARVSRPIPQMTDAEALTSAMMLSPEPMPQPNRRSRSAPAVSVHPKARNQEEITRIVQNAHRARSSQAVRNTMRLDGRCFVITGKLSAPRREIQQKIRDLGGSVVDSIRNGVDCLICGDKPGSKVVKANELGIPIMVEADFDRMCSYHAGN